MREAYLKYAHWLRLDFPKIMAPAWDGLALASQQANEGTNLAKASNDPTVLRDLRTQKSIRSSSVVHLVKGGDVVLDNNRNPM